MTTKEGAERWQAKRGTVAERNKYMFNNPLMSNIKFSFPGKDKIIPAHKYVLAVSSSVFFAMFYGDLAETRDTIDIIDCDPDTFLNFLRYIYCDEAIFKDTDSAVKVMLLADKYDVPSLTSEIVKYLDGEMDPRSAFDLLTLARQFNVEGLERVCWEVIQYNAIAIATSDSFLNVKYDLLFSFVQRSPLRIAETTLFQAVDRWAAKRCEEAGVVADGERKRDVLGEDLLRHFAFPQMQPREFSAVVLPKEILTKDEVIDVFKYFSDVPVRGGIKFKAPLRNSKSKKPPGIAPVLCYPMLGFTRKFRFSPFTDMKLTFAVSEGVSLCGLEFLFAKDDNLRSICLSVLCRGEKIKELNAQHRDHYDCNLTYPKSFNNEGTNVFFNRPIRVRARTCYTIVVLETSSRSKECYVHGRSSTRDSSGQSERRLSFDYCGGCYTEEVPKSGQQFSGFISALLYTNV